MNYRTSMKNISPGEHLCFMYKTEDEHRNILAPFIRYGLEQGEKVIYAVDAHSKQDVLLYLEQEGFRLDDYIASGQLIMSDASEIYLRGGEFDPDRIIDLLKKETDRALKEGYKALRCTGEASLFQQGFSGSERLMEYEAKLNRVFPDIKAIGLCQYDMRIFEPEILLDVLSTHPVIVFEDKYYDNLYYIPPDKFLGPDRNKVELQYRLNNLKNHFKNLKTLKETKQNYLELFYNSPLGIALTDSVGTLRLVNPEMARMLGASSPEEAIERFQELSTELYVDPGRREELIQILKENGQVENFEYQAKDLEGRKFWLSLNAWIRDWLPDGKFIIDEFATDITDRKNKEKEISKKL